MVTPYDNEGKIDYKSLEALVNWYIDHGANGLFAVCQSSEMFFLSLDERLNLAKQTVKFVAGRVPVIASGHISESLEAQKKELSSMAKTGIDALVLVTNRLAKEQESDEIWKMNFVKVIEELPEDVILGFYECPFPYKRVLSNELIHWLKETGRVGFIKDTCCDLELIKARADECNGSNLKLFNANSASLFLSISWGYSGFCGVMANFQMDLYAWLYENWKNTQLEPQEISDFLGFSSMLESRGYPVNAKYFLTLEKIPMNLSSRSSDKILSSTERMEIEQFHRVTKNYKKLLSM
jgi:4-hydroxy-tetrahydrodipicolinate synthase